jgi:uncharacterized protein
MPFLLFALLVAAAPAETPVRALIVTGVDHPAHDWVKTAPAVRSILEKGGRVSARIVEDPEFLASDAVFDYDVIVLHFRNDKPLKHDAQARSNLKAFTDRGGGLVAIHFACGAFPGWSDYGKIVGRVWDTVNTHDPRGPFRVTVTDTSHPITRGCADFDTDDELYTGLTGDTPVTLLARAHGKTTNRDHPMAFTLTSGRGRVFHTPLGHDVKALTVPAVSDLIRKGCLWAAGREP